MKRLSVALVIAALASSAAHAQSFEQRREMLLYQRQQPTQLDIQRQQMEQQQAEFDRQQSLFLQQQELNELRQQNQPRFRVQPLYFGQYQPYLPQ